jgi:acyl-CoA synthetase (AMP-forming)/AMP-acid ligase II
MSLAARTPFAQLTARTNAQRPGHCCTLIYTCDLSFVAPLLSPALRRPQRDARPSRSPALPRRGSPCGSWRGARQDIDGRLDRRDGTNNCRDAAVWDDVCLCLGPTSSGTTGDPKGVMISHDNVTWTARAALEHIAPMTGVYDEPDGRIISFLPLSHIAAQVGGVFARGKTGRRLRELKLPPPPRARSGPPNARV